MKISNNGLDLIKQFEGLSLTPYLCPANIPTIGYGNTFYEDGTKVTLKDKPITEQRASELIEYIVNKTFSDNINKVVKVPLNQNQFDALVSFVFNCGSGNFAKSTLLKMIRVNPNSDNIRFEFSRWNKGGGKVLGGLTRRRKAESDLYFKIS